MVSQSFSIITFLTPPHPPPLPGRSRPTIQSTCDSLLLLSGNPISTTIYLSSSHSILCLCLFNTRWSCPPRIGCLRSDAERFPIDRMERNGKERGYRIGGEEKRGRVDGQAKCFGSKRNRADDLPQTENSRRRMEAESASVECWDFFFFFFMRNCTVLQQNIEPQYLNPFYYRRQLSLALKWWRVNMKSLPMLLCFKYLLW